MSAEAREEVAVSNGRSREDREPTPGRHEDHPNKTDGKYSLAVVVVVAEGGLQFPEAAKHAELGREAAGDTVPPEVQHFQLRVHAAPVGREGSIKLIAFKVEACGREKDAAFA